MARRSFVFVVMGMLMFLFHSVSSAAIPDMINYQGVLTSSGGSPIDTTVSMTFRVYEDSTTGIYLWTETHDSVKVEDGVFSVLLGSTSSIPDSVFDGSLRYLGLTVGSDPEMTPRRPLASVGYAFRSQHADTAQYALVGAADNDWVIQGDTVYHLAGSVGIGTANPTEKLDISGNIHASGTIRSGNSITVDGASDKIIASSGRIDFDDEDLVTTGDMGIGTTSPGVRLTVVEGGGSAPSDTVPIAQFVNNSNPGVVSVVANAENNGAELWLGGPTSYYRGRVRYVGLIGTMFFFTENSPRMTIDSSGNVGIGTLTPTAPLEVAGTVHSTSGGFKFPDGTTQTTAASGGGGLSSIDSVSNPGGDVDLVAQNAVTITPNDGANTITIGETHSGLTNNPHAVTATQTGALVSVDGVANAGGDVNFVAGANISITPDNTGDSIVFSAIFGYANVFTVASSGGNFTTIGQALGACVSPSSSNTYLIRVMPGTYSESVICKSFVRLQGAGKYASYITGSVTGADSSTIDGLNIGGGIVCAGTSPTITHSIITNGLGHGIWITGGGTPWIKEDEIVDCNAWGIHCDGWGTDAWIIANKIERNGQGGSGGGIRCTDSSPTISNNQILQNETFGIYLIGGLGTPSEPTIDDNVIGRTQPAGAGVGIYMINYAEPRIYANDIWINYTGIEIHAQSQPSILANNLGYNNAYGIRCYSSGSSKPVVIKGNHIHSHSVAGLDIVGSSPIVTHNNIHSNPVVDIQYDPASAPVVSLNVFDVVAGAGTAGLYNVTTLGLPIAP